MSDVIRSRPTLASRAADQAELPEDMSDNSQLRNVRRNGGYPDPPKPFEVAGRVSWAVKIPFPITKECVFMVDPLLAGLDPPSQETPPPLTPKQRAWLALLDLAPDLTRIRWYDKFQPSVPPAVSDGLFLNLCASFIDPRKRGIWRAILVDLLADDLREEIRRHLMEGEQ